MASPSRPHHNHYGGVIALTLTLTSYGGVIAFNVDECWYLDSQFCAPLHAFKMAIGAAKGLRGLG